MPKMCVVGIRRGPKGRPPGQPEEFTPGNVLAPQWPSLRKDIG